MRTPQILFFALYCFLLCSGAGCKNDSDPGQNTTTPPPAGPETTFTNPLLPSGPDPWVAQKDSFYYYTHTLGNRIALARTRHMSQLREAPLQTIWTPPAQWLYSRNLWAPELHFVDGKWYVYFAADGGQDKDHRMYVLENASADPTTGTWEFKGKIADSSDKWAIDGTVLEHNGKQYFLWSGWRGDNDPGVQQLYIARMTNPWTLEGERVMLSEPVYPWERNGLVNEGPQVLKNKAGQVFLIYSASGCWTDDYALGMLTLKEGGDPLKPADWTKKPNPVFSKSPAGNAYGPGHNGFFTSPDGTEDWIIYHANSSPGQGCSGGRSPRMQKFTWNTDGTPNFGEPVSLSSQISRPSGEVK
ncbi:glycoside hydrolase family 43 protein [Pontibacter beigongshangensis]|uniref:glycoside hydrolase family 43 protein n=1 Tax=Pontibacter beigongshangensis TaxID=2574733 RepID=UPI00164F92FA|nr:glycoside hydrolase family 43 protein [Pontibacter beigongshangensis]